MGSFELMSSKDLAYQMTVYDWELFHCVHEVCQTTEGMRNYLILRLRPKLHPIPDIVHYFQKEPYGE
jgi:hypothetical protein